jgi:hypothetical protein
MSTLLNLICSLIGFLFCQEWNDIAIDDEKYCHKHLLPVAVAFAINPVCVR